MAYAPTRRISAQLVVILLTLSWLNALVPVAPHAAASSAPASYMLKACPAYTGSNPYDAGQCTWYAFSRRPDLPHFAAHLPPAADGTTAGTAKNWASSAAECGFVVDSTPQAGDIVVIPPGVHGALAPWGHVAYVRAVKPDGTISIQEYNAEKKEAYGERHLIPDPSLRFIHSKGAPKEPELLGNAAGPNAAFPLNTAVRFAWTDVGDEYVVEVNPVTAGSKAFTSGWIRETTWMSPALAHPGQYTWRARARNDNGLGPWSRSQAFTVRPAEPQSPDQQWTWETGSFFSLAPFMWKFTLDDLTGEAQVRIDGKIVVDTRSECHSIGTIELGIGFHEYQLGYPKGDVKPRLSYGPAIVPVACAANPIVTPTPAPTSTPRPTATPVPTPSATPEPTPTPSPTPVPPAAPTDLGIFLQGTLEIVHLSWSDNATDERGFVIHLLEGGNDTVVAEVGPDTTFYEMNWSLLPAADVCFVVDTVGHQGGVAASQRICLGSADDDDPYVATPSEVRAELISPSEVLVTWADTSDEEFFHVWRSVIHPHTVATTTSTSFTFMLPDGAPILDPQCFWVTAVWGTNVSDASSRACLEPVISGPPNQPSNIWFEAFIDTGTSMEIIIHWDDKSDNESGFRIYHNMGRPGVPGEVRLVGEVGPDVTEFATPQFFQAWCFDVTAYNEHGESPPVTACGGGGP